MLAQGGDAGGEGVLLAGLPGAQGGGKTKAGGALPWTPREPPLIVRMRMMGWILRLSIGAEKGGLRQA